MKILRRTLVGLIASSCVLLSGSAAYAASSTRPQNAATCTGGTIAPGTYTSLTVTGNCSLPTDGGVIIVRGGLTIAPNAVLNAVTPATLNVSGGIFVQANGSLLLGCSPAAGCATTTSDRIAGGIQANQPLALILHSNTIDGGLSVQGGGGGVNCDVNPVLAQILGFPSPAYSTFEDNTIRGSVSVSGVQSCWFGFIRNDVHGTVTIANNTFADPDATEVTTNMVRGNLVCLGNNPVAQIGDSSGQPNTVTGQKIGECAAL